MDLTDKRIATLLQSNARMSFAEIGRVIALSRTAVQDRVTRMEERGEITGYHAHLADPDALGLAAVIFVRINTRPCQPVLEWLRQLEGVNSVQSLSGETDAILHCRLPSADHLTRLNDQIGAHPAITEARSSLVLKTL